MKNTGVGILEAISTRSDGSLKIVIGTNEVDSTEASRLFDLRNKFIKYLLSDNNISPLDEQLIDDVKIRDGKKVKTPSQRLRAVMFRVCEQSGNKEHFEEYYLNEMENLINNYKSRLDSEL